jgi:hypothetical protein
MPGMPRTARALALAVTLLLAVVAGAQAAPPKVEVGKPRLATTPAGDAALLVPVSYPIEMAGRRVRLTATLRDPDGKPVRSWTVRPAANAGPLRAPDRRTRFVFVHRIDLGPEATAELRAGARVHVGALARLNADGDGTAELRRADAAVHAAPLTPGGAHLCATPPKQRSRPGAAVVVPLPLCNRPVRWRLTEQPSHGSARLRDGKLFFKPGKRFRGTASITLAASAGTRADGARAAVTPIALLTPVQITIAAAESPVVRALGDSVTAGFGYYEHGESMGIGSLLSCRPGATTYDDACSSNSSVRSNKAEGVEYAPDFGLANNVSWAAQWANAHGITNFKNFAVSGSEPANWFGKGQFADTLEQLTGEDPDYVLMTMGANPLLSNMLFGIGNIGCGIWSDLFGRFRECVEREFTAIGLRPNLKTLYSKLVSETDAAIFVMQYHLSIPSSALYSVDQIAVMGRLMNEEIEAAAREVGSPRITVVSPPHFDVGLSLAPIYPSNFQCKGIVLTSRVDGRSVQSALSQGVLRGLHPLEFCPGAKGEAPWVISGDTGIHPSAAGYTQMAAQVPAPQ